MTLDSKVKALRNAAADSIFWDRKGIQWKTHRKEAITKLATAIDEYDAEVRDASFDVDQYSFMECEDIAWGYRLIPWDQSKPHGPFTSKKKATAAARARIRGTPAGRLTKELQIRELICAPAAGVGSEEEKDG